MGAEGKTTIVACQTCGRVRGINGGRLEWSDSNPTMAFMVNNPDGYVLVKSFCDKCGAETAVAYRQMKIGL